MLEIRFFSFRNERVRGEWDMRRIYRSTVVPGSILYFVYISMIFELMPWIIFLFPFFLLLFR